MDVVVFCLFFYLSGVGYVRVAYVLFVAWGCCAVVVGCCLLLVFV